MGNAGEEEASKEEERATIVEAIEMLNETSRESLERVYADAFFDHMVWTSRRLKDPPNDEEAKKLEGLEIYLEIGEGIDLERLGPPPA